MTAVDLLGLQPGQVMMVAAHINDLNAAHSFGLRTGFVHRPNEYGPSRQADNASPGQFDVVARGLADLASQLGA
jgi:2-haloacid dehalogenase